MFRPLSQTKFINDANLVSYWKLEDLTDSKGSNNLTNNGSVAFNSAKFDNGADFGTSNTTKSLSNSSLTLNANAFTIVSWFNESASAPSDIASIICQDNTTSGSNFRCFQFAINSSNYFRFLRFDASNNLVTNLSNAVALNDGIWHQVVATFDNTIGSRIYVDGVLKNSDSVTTANHVGTTRPTYIGASEGVNGAVGNWFSGKIDDTAIFSRALSAGEVAELYQSRTLGEYLPNSNTKLLLHLNGSSADSSGNNNNGTDTDITYSQANGKFGQGAGFANGTSSGGSTAVNYITIPTSSTLSPGTGNWVISLWFKTNDTRGGDRAQIINKYGTSTNNNYQINIGTDFKLTGYFRDSGNNNVSVTTSYAVNDNVWRNVVWVRNGTSGLLYVNGKLEGSSTNASLNNIDTSATNPLYIGTYLGLYANGSYYGQLDEVIIENRAWSASEVKKYYTNAKGRFGII